MAKTAHDLLDPVGRLDGPVLWPKLDANKREQRLNQYLKEGYAKAASIGAASKDEAAMEWAYYRAYQNVYERLVTRPSTVQLGDEGSASYLLTQIEHVGHLATEALARFEELLAEVTAVTVPALGRSSASVRAEIQF